MAWFSSDVQRDEDGNVVSVNLFKSLSGWPSNDKKDPNHGHTKMTTTPGSETAHVDYKRTGPRGSTPQVTKPGNGYNVKK